MQVALPIVLALTYPGDKNALGVKVDAGWTAVLAEPNRKTVLVPLVTILTAGIINLMVIEPMVVKIMRERKHQGTVLAVVTS